MDNYDGIILSNQPCYGMNMMNQPTIWTMYWAIIFCVFSRIWSRWLLLFSHWLTRESIPPKRQIQDVSLRDFSGLKCVNMGNMQATCSFSPTESGMANTEECQRWVASWHMHPMPKNWIRNGENPWVSCPFSLRNLLEKLFGLDPHFLAGSTGFFLANRCTLSLSTYIT